jgi:hypothetical protein
MKHRGLDQPMQTCRFLFHRVRSDGTQHQHFPFLKSDRKYIVIKNKVFALLENDGIYGYKWR